MIRVQFHDGRVIDNLTMNGNNFVSKVKVEDSIFEGNLDTVTITDTETGEVETMTDAVLVQNKQYGNEWWFILRDKTPMEKLHETLAGATGDITSIEVALAEVYELIIGG